MHLPTYVQMCNKLVNKKSWFAFCAGYWFLKNRFVLVVLVRWKLSVWVTRHISTSMKSGYPARFNRMTVTKYLGGKEYLKFTHQYHKTVNIICNQCLLMPSIYPLLLSIAGREALREENQNFPTPRVNLSHSLYWFICFHETMDKEELTLPLTTLQRRP